MTFLKEHLEGHYEWIIGPTHSIFSGSPTRRIFDRLNGIQLLFIINSFAALLDTFSIEDGKNVEDLIMKHLPLNIQSEIYVLRWLRFRWDVA
jgi:hypothetical protein